MIEKSDVTLESAWVAGGGSQSKAWLNIIAAATGLTLKVPDSGAQGAALGAARLAMAAAGLKEVFKSPSCTALIVPDIELSAAYRKRQKSFRAAYQALREEAAS